MIMFFLRLSAICDGRYHWHGHSPSLCTSNSYHLLDRARNLFCVPVLYFWINVPILRLSHGDQCSSLSVYLWQALSLTWLVGVFNSQRPRNIVSTKNRKNESIFCRLGCRRCHWLHYKSKVKWGRGRRALCGMKDHFSYVEFEGKCRIIQVSNFVIVGVRMAMRKGMGWLRIDVDMFLFIT